MFMGDGFGNDESSERWSGHLFQDVGSGNERLHVTREPVLEHCYDRSNTRGPGRLSCGHIICRRSNVAITSFQERSMRSLLVQFCLCGDEDHNAVDLVVEPRRWDRDLVDRFAR